MAIVIPTTGWLLQRVGRRTAFLMAMGSFSIGTLICAVAPVFPVPHGPGRAGVRTAIMMPLLMFIILVPSGWSGRRRATVPSQ